MCAVGINIVKCVAGSNMDILNLWVSAVAFVLFDSF